MKKILKFTFMLVALVGLGLTQSCKEEIDLSDRYTFTEETITGYMEKHEAYSEYLRLLGEVKISKRSSSTVRQLLSARGKYTVFAPTNKAIQEYLDTVYRKGIIVAPSWDAIDDQRVKDSLMQVIVYNSVLDGGDNIEAYQTGSFPSTKGGEFAVSNMNDRKLTFNYPKQSPDSMYINGTIITKGGKEYVVNGALVDLKNRDILASNGYLHQVHSVVAPSSETVADVFRRYIETNEQGYIVAAKVLDACGLYDELAQYRDEVYEEKSLADEIPNLATHPSFKKPGYLPEHRKFGFTLFLETDDFWMQEIGKALADITPADLQDWVVAKGYYPNATSTDYKSDNNALRQFITYHILPMRIPIDKLVIHYNEKGYNYESNPNGAHLIPTWELYTTLGPRRLLKIYEGGPSPAPEGIWLNRFPELDNGRQGSYCEVGCQLENEGVRIKTENAVDVLNGYIYPIDQPLVYSDEVRKSFRNQRLRFDVASLFPEFMNNDIRPDRSGKDQNLCVGIPITNQYQYLADLTVEEGTDFYYLSGFKQGWKNYQGDEMNVTGAYEMTFRLPPVPLDGTYEIRYAVQNNSNNRGMCQVYFGTDPEALPVADIPLDLRIGGSDKVVGWVADNPTTVPNADDLNAENDKKMRNYGFMKAPQYYAPKGSNAREDKNTTRRIIVKKPMEANKTYYLKFKSVLKDTSKEFYMDYLEFCAKEVYDNPASPEDIW